MTVAPHILKGDNILDIESNCAWAVPGTWTTNNKPCYEDGCVPTSAPLSSRSFSLTHTHSLSLSLSLSLSSLSPGLVLLYFLLTLAKYYVLMTSLLLHEGRIAMLKPITCIDKTVHDVYTYLNPALC